MQWGVARVQMGVAWVPMGVARVDMLPELPHSPVAVATDTDVSDVGDPLPSDDEEGMNEEGTAPRRECLCLNCWKVVLCRDPIRLFDLSYDYQCSYKVFGE